MVFGVAIFICTQAQTQGFTKNFIDSTLGSNGAIMSARAISVRVTANLYVAPKNANVEAARRRYFEGITNASEIMRISRRFPNVVACAPVLRGTLTARAEFETATVDLFGIDPALHLRTTDIGRAVIAGKFDDFRNNPSSLIVGSRLAEALGVKAGDRCNCSRRAANTGALPSPRSPAAVSGRSIPPASIATRKSRSAFCTSLIRRP